MELRHIETLATKIKEIFDLDEMSGSNAEDITVGIELTPQTFYAIDKKFYRDSHNNSIEGFESGDEIQVTMNNVKFLLVKQKIEGQLLLHK